MGPSTSEAEEGELPPNSNRTGPEHKDHLSWGTTFMGLLECEDILCARGHEARSLQNLKFRLA